jgi:hypothetical protein
VAYRAGRQNLAQISAVSSLDVVPLALACHRALINPAARLARFDWRDCHTLALKIDLDLHVNAGFLRRLEGAGYVNLFECAGTFAQARPLLHRFLIDDANRRRAAYFGRPAGQQFPGSLHIGDVGACRRPSVRT